VIFDRIMSLLGLLARAFGWLCLGVAILLATAWMAVVLFFDGPLGSLNAGLAALSVLAVLAILRCIQPAALKFAVLLALGFGVALWWLTLSPSQGRAWPPEMAQTAWAESEGETITLHNLRECDSQSPDRGAVRWTSRTLQLTDIVGLDLFLGYRGRPLLAQPIVSFQMASGLPICVSVEPRREVGERFSPLESLCRHYELAVILADERDLVLRHTQSADGEELFLFPLQTPPEQARALFVDYLRLANELNKEPEWYHLLTAHVTESLRLHRLAFGAARPWDWRRLFTGKLAERACDLGLLQNTRPFSDFQRLSRVNGHARLAADDPDFSARLREALPGHAAPSE